MNEKITNSILKMLLLQNLDGNISLERPSLQPSKKLGKIREHNLE